MEQNNYQGAFTGSNRPSKSTSDIHLPGSPDKKPDMLTKALNDMKEISGYS